MALSLCHLLLQGLVNQLRDVLGICGTLLPSPFRQS